MNERFYPQGFWCNKFYCWCDDVVDITDGHNECNGDCKNCKESEVIRPNE